jgi:hypothetical protein
MNFFTTKVINSTPKKKGFEIATTLSTHTACFICRGKQRTLHRVKKEDIVLAYSSYGIYVKNNARVCDEHLNDNGFIRKEEIRMSPTKMRTISSEKKTLLDIVGSYNNFVQVFEQFKNMECLEETHCMNVTGWSKADFQRFSSCITSINNNDGRSKEQLIALYRYWLRTGLDQKSLAIMFGKYTTQEQISAYLRQARVAIHKDFVPSCLGANKNREFFLQFNTLMTQSVFNLAENVLVIVADGTYCKIEKSSNNDFQHSTYSTQKKYLLFKPFIICCADGYIIDCYGPFAATQNDAEIMDYIIESDDDLKKLLVANETVILMDKGKLIFKLLVVLKNIVSKHVYYYLHIHK